MPRDFKWKYKRLTEEFNVVFESDRTRPYEDEYGSGFLDKESWRLKGQLHRVGGPAVTIRHPRTRAVIEEYYYKAGRLDRIFGLPAVTIRDPHTREIKEERHFVNGEEIDPNNFTPPPLTP